MNWLLTIPSSFSLNILLTRSRSLLLPPFSIDWQQRLERVERLSSGRTLLISLNQTRAGLHLRSDQRLGGTEAEEVSRKVWRMLRLGENFTSFSEMLAEHPMLERCLRQGFRFLRGSSLFEDIVKAQILTYWDENAVGKIASGVRDQGDTHSRWVRGERCLAALVDHLGSALSANPTRHAFPTPTQISEYEDKVKEILGLELATHVLTAADRFLEAPNTFAELLRRDIPTHAVRQTLTSFPGMNPSAMAIAMLALGRYDYLPLDELSEKSHLLMEYMSSDTEVDLSKIQTVFEAWRPWSGLIYWLWDWQVCSPAFVAEGAEVHEHSVC